jgi:hypothetical protein
MKEEEQMVDNVNPNSQFHPYQPMDATPNSEKIGSGLSGILKKIGIDDRSVEKARGFARKNPNIVLGGLAALAIGMGLLRRRT